MKYSSMKTIKFLMMLALVLTSLSSKAEKLTAEQVWVEGMSWTEVKKILSWDDPRVTVFSLVDSKTVDGRVYSNVAVNGEKSDMWVYVDSNRVYSCPDPEEGHVDGNGLYMFDFNNWEKDMRTKWYGTYEEELGDYYCEEVEFSNRTLLPEAYPGAPEVWAYYSSDKQLETGEIWIEGIGHVGFCGLLAYPNQTIIASTTYHFVSEVRLPNGQVIYCSPRPEAGVSQLEFDTAKGTLLYDLFGRQVVNPQSGCVYIQNGKKVIFPNR